MPGKQKAKYIQSLGQKKHRDEEGLFVAEGPKVVAELLEAAGANILEIYAVKEWLNHSRLPATTRVVEEVTEDELGRLSQMKTPHQVIAVVKQFGEQSPANLEGRVSLVLDTIQDPGNMGTIIRIADWFGISQLICSPDCADVYNPKVVQATMGSLARVRTYYTDLLPWLQKQENIRKYATALEGKDVTKMNALVEGLVIIGNESRGVSADLLALANEKITIPRKGKAESLNAAVAAGIILFQLAR
jgi:TrmH family RNA methyltransferase